MTKAPIEDRGGSGVTDHGPLARCARDSHGRFQLIAAALSMVFAITVLAGWAIHNEAMTRFIPGSTIVNPMSAVGILAVSLALFFHCGQRLALFYMLAGASLVIGTTKFVQFVFDQPNGIDQLLFAARVHGLLSGRAPNAMATDTGLALAALGFALIASHSRDSRIIVASQIICLLTAVMAAAALLGHLLGVVSMYQIDPLTSMATPVAIALLALSIAIIRTNPDDGVMRISRDTGPAGSLARTAFPLALLVPVIVSVAGWAGQRAGYYGAEPAVAIVLLATILVNFALLGGWIIARYRRDHDRQRREAALIRSEHQYRQAEGVAHLGNWKVEFPSRAVQWSDGFVRICGLAANNVPDLDAAMGVYHPDDSQIVRLALAQAEGQCTNWEIACRVRRPDGETRYVKSHGVCELNEAGETREIFGVISDITDLEIARREAEAAKTTTATFLANMSHEIRTPMNGVMGFVELLLDSELDDIQRRHLSIIQESAQTLLKLLNDILDISKIEAGGMEIERGPYNTHYGIEQCVRLMTPLAEQKGLDISLSFAANAPPHIVLDGLRLRQILLNLIGNAIKFTHRGYVVVSVAKRMGSFGEASLEVSVSDSGIGIPHDRIASIFDSFVQAELTTTRCFGGSGLGLSISRRLAELMDGTIEVQSAVGKGTKMTLVLPLVDCAGAETHDSDISPRLVKRRTDLAADNGAKVLVVEDVDINQELFTEMLVRLGHQVDTASDGAEAVMLARKLLVDPATWDIILMDLQMPVMDGLTATKAIRALGGRGATIPIIALTASAFEEDRRACEAAGMSDHIAKPVGIEPLGRIISHWKSVQHPLPVAPADPVRADPVRSPSLERRFAERLRNSRERLSAIADELDGASADSLKDLLVEARAIAHVLSGTAGMFGELALGKTAAKAEERIAAHLAQQTPFSSPKARPVLESLIAALITRDECAAAAAAGGDNAVGDAALRRIATR